MKWHHSHYNCWLVTGLSCLMYFVPFAVYLRAEADYLSFDVRFARAYHLRGLLFHAMGEHRYFLTTITAD